MQHLLKHFNFKTMRLGGLPRRYIRGSVSRSCHVGTPRATQAYDAGLTGVTGRERGGTGASAASCAGPWQRGSRGERSGRHPACVATGTGGCEPSAEKAAGRAWAPASWRAPCLPVGLQECQLVDTCRQPCHVRGVNLHERHGVL